MNIVDIAIALVFIWFALNGYWKGFISQSLELIVTIVAFFLSFFLYHDLSQFIGERINLATSLINAISFMAIFISIIFLYHFLFIIFYDRIPEKIRESTTNLLTGVIPSLVRASLFIWIILSIIVILPVPTYLREKITDSYVGGPLVKSAPIVESYIEKIFGGTLEETITFLTVKPESDEKVDLGFKTTKTKVDSACEEEMFGLVNNERSNQGLNKLMVDSKLQEVARLHSTDMFWRGYFAHNNPDGLTPFDRMDKLGIKYIYAGENLALAPDVEIAHNGLMNSPGHRANILSVNFGKVGIGCIDGGIYGKMISQEFTN